MPNRIIKESINESKGLSECSIFAQDLYKRLITYADDYGRFNIDSTIILARLYPREMDVVSSQIIEDAIQELVCANKIGAYHCRARPKDLFGAFPKWGEHQRVRNTRAKCPDPEEEVNDWYYRRFIPIELKVAVLDKHGGKCAICGKFLVPPGVSSKEAIKLHTGAIHFDHIVPVEYGGRATIENLRPTCPKCNLSRRKKFTTSDILSELRGDMPQPAATCGEISPRACVYENPIQSNPNPNPESKTREDALAGFDGELRLKLEEWLRYKQERREGYKPTGLRNFVSEIKNKRSVYSDAQICALISECMANGWKGIIWDKLNSPSQKQNKSAQTGGTSSIDMDKLHRMLHGGGE